MLGNFLKIKSKRVILSLNSNRIKFFSKKPKISDEKSPSEEFEKHINSVSKSDEENYTSIEHYMKTFNDKVYKQNVELSNKLIDIFKDEKSLTGAKIFTSINEINKINLNNSSKLLQVFLNQIFKYNDSVKLFIEQSEMKNSRYRIIMPLTLFFLWICGIIYLFSFYKKNFINYDKIFDNLMRNYTDVASKSFKINIKYPIFDDHKNLINSINFDSNKHLLLIGPPSIGKTESIKHFCLTQCMKDVLTIYIDLNSISNTNENFDFKEIIKNILIENYHGNEISPINRNLLENETTTNKLFEYMKEKETYFVFDNYSHDRDNKRVMTNSTLFIKNNPFWRSLIVTNNNIILENATVNHYEIKYLNFLQTRSFKNYLVEKLNTYCKKRIEFSNLELFSEENINLLFKNFYFISFDDLFAYLDSNNSIESIFIFNIIFLDYLTKKNNDLKIKLQILKTTDNNSFIFLSKICNSKKNYFEWSILPYDSKSVEIQQLEKLGLIFTKDYSNYVILNSKTKDIISEIEKNNKI